MKKIPTIFKRDFTGNPRFVLNEIEPAAQWVFDGEGVATRKYDGTACMILNGSLYKRHDVKKGRINPPLGFIPAQERDEITGHWPGWISIGDGPEDKWHRAAFDNTSQADGTYELCGPKVQANPEAFTQHILVPHGSMQLDDAPRHFEELKTWPGLNLFEGVVWHHPDGRMAKIKGKDFGIKRWETVRE